MLGSGILRVTSSAESFSLENSWGRCRSASGTTPWHERPAGPLRRSPGRAGDVERAGCQPRARHHRADDQTVTDPAAGAGIGREFRDGPWRPLGTHAAIAVRSRREGLTGVRLPAPRPDPNPCSYQRFPPDGPALRCRRGLPPERPSSVRLRATGGPGGSRRSESPGILPTFVSAFRSSMRIGPFTGANAREAACRIPTGLPV